MKPFQCKSEIYGNWATLILPIQDDDSIDYELLSDEIDFMISCSVDGIYSNGTAGEFYTQSRNEFLKIQTLFSEKCEKASIPFQIGASHMSSQESLYRIEAAKSLKLGAFQVILPDWFPVNLETAVRFLERAAEAASPIPLVVYNPPHAKVTFNPSEWLSIIEKVPEIIGMKVAGGDDRWYSEMKPVLDKISVFIPGHQLASGIDKGAMGAYSNMACLHPGGSQRWYNLIKRNPDEGVALEKKIRSFMDTHIVPFLEAGFPNHACDKCLSVAGGWLPGITTRLRFPYSSISMEKAAETGRIALHELPEFFANG